MSHLGFQIQKQSCTNPSSEISVPICKHKLPLYCTISISSTPEAGVHYSVVGYPYPDAMKPSVSAQKQKAKAKASNSLAQQPWKPVKDLTYSAPKKRGKKDLTNLNYVHYFPSHKILHYWILKGYTNGT
ncbi:hypothetical protein KC19_9G120200 [Ceratodon purpureus]|uniref:Uncharacterized protein n=1 Tax=Ceratodon purpureus TaxID=3225 RepID=A0A8T0GT78_CERPU|nr:hypothetical protein KC19_9G120200 [Ceratodon purpureus]